MPAIAECDTLPFCNGIPVGQLAPGGNLSLFINMLWFLIRRRSRGTAFGMQQLLPKDE
jgi:hypothetical protein